MKKTRERKEKRKPPEMSATMAKAKNVGGPKGKTQEVGRERSFRGRTKESNPRCVFFCFSLAPSSHRLLLFLCPAPYFHCCSPASPFFFFFFFFFLSSSSVFQPTRGQPRLHGLAHATQPLNRGCHVVRPPEIKHLVPKLFNVVAPFYVYFFLKKKKKI